MADRIVWKLADVIARIEKLLQPRLKRVGAEMRRHIVKMITEGKTRIDGPSKPGEPPHIDTGRLAKSIFWRYDPDILTVFVGTDVWYGLTLEIGSARVAPRPYLRPALHQMMTRIRVILRA